VGKFVTAGPHVFRLEKRGDVLTMSVGDIDQNEFRPYFQKSVLNLKSAAPFLARGNCSVFIQAGGGSIQGMRMLVDGRPAETPRPNCPRRNRRPGLSPRPRKRPRAIRRRPRPLQLPLRQFRRPRRRSSRQRRSSP
jgi:hypothetical protein